MAYFRIGTGGSMKLVKAGTLSGNGSLNCTSISGYQSLTADDFLVVATKLYGHCSLGGSGKGSDVNYTVTKSYNATTGMLTVSGLAFGNVRATNGESGRSATADGRITADVYAKIVTYGGTLDINSFQLLSTSNPATINNARQYKILIAFFCSSSGGAVSNGSITCNDPNCAPTQVFYVGQTGMIKVCVPTLDTVTFQASYRVQSGYTATIVWKIFGLS